MVQLRVWVVHHKLSCLTYLQTVINIIEGNLEGFIETAYFLVNAALCHQACRRHCGIILGADDPAEVTGVVSGLIDKTVSGNTGKSDHNTRVLDRVIFIIKSCPDDSDIVPHTIS